jgi:predicted DNA-binding transcriptional regulator AlpA
MEDKVRLMDARALKEERGIDYSDTHRDRLIKAGKFPKPVKFGPGSKLHWIESEIDEWLAAKIAQREETAS